MILPTKGISPDRALLAIGAQVIMQLDQPRTVSQAWARLVQWRESNNHLAPISFGWFVLSLDILFALGVVELDEDVLSLRRRDALSARRR
jgi:hypothetical protein